MAIDKPRDAAGAHKPVLALTSVRRGFYIGVVKWRNQLLALFCLVVFFAFGVFYFRYWVVQKPFGIILFVGEGLGPDRLAIARIYAGGADKPLSIDSLTYSALLKNYSRDSAIPDDAAAASALATGVKVNNGAIGVDPEGKALENLLELARASGRMTGLVTDGRLTSPTAASFYAHASSKDGRANLARDLVEKGNVDLVLGGGAEDFLPVSKGGKRSDDRDLLTEMENAGYNLVRTRDQLDDIPRWRQAKLFGIFSPAALPFTGDENVGEEPSLSDMVRRGIELLQFNSGGYLLVVDAGLMHNAAQNNDARHTLSETIELDRAVAVALEYAGANSTVLVCGDVAIEQLNLTGAPPRDLNGESLLGLNPAGEPWLAWSMRSSGTMPLERPSDEAPRDSPDSVVGAEAARTPEGSSPGPVSPASDQRRAEDVAGFGIGLGADALHGTVESTAIFEIIRDNL